MRFIAIDGSTVQEPGAKETTYRLHIAFDLVNQTLHQVEVTTDKFGENLDHYRLTSGDVVVIDRGYNQPKTLVPFIAKGGDIVLRYNAHSMKLYERSNDESSSNLMSKVNWINQLKLLNNQPGCVPVWLCHDNKRIEGYVHAIPLPHEQAEKARRKAQQRAKEKGRTASAEVLYTSGWVLVFTSLPLTALSTMEAAKLYRVRWQVELVIKRLKSILNINKLRSFKGAKLSDLYLYGKLLYAAVLEKIAQKRFNHACRKLDAPRQLTDWRLWKTIHHDLKAGIVTCFLACACFTNDMLKSLTERPRKRSLQVLPDSILRLLVVCRELGVSNV